MRPAFAGHTLTATVFAATVILWAVIEAGQGLRRRTGASNQDAGSLMFLRVMAISAALVAALVGRVPFTAYGYSVTVMAISLAFMWTGLGLRLWSFRTLGRYFTFQVMTSADQPVIMSGPYKYIRHPSYLGLLLILGGVGLSYGTWLSFVALTLLPLAGFVNRIRVEESALASALGDRYTTYAAGRRRLIPYVW